MERETKTIKTPLGRDIEIKTYMTLREKQEIQAIYLKGMKAEIGEKGTPQIKELQGDILNEAQRKLLELGIVSYDGSKENIVNRILDAPFHEGEFILKQLDEIFGSGFQTAK